MKMSVDEDDSTVFWVNKERNCPLCGLKMKQLSFQLWQCKCGYKAKEKETEEEGEEDYKRRHRLGGEKDRRFREQKQPPQKGLRPT